MPPTASLAWVGDLSEVVEQAAALGGCQRNRGVQILRGRGDAR
jgi:hypothetical protein